MMKQEHINPFIEATVSTFETMCNISISRDGNLRLRQGIFPTYDLVGIIGLSGLIKGAIILAMPPETGFKIIGAFVGTPFDTINTEFMDAYGEILNIIAGSAAGKLENFRIKISLPTVLLGKDQKINSKGDIPWIVIPLKTSENDKLCLEVSMQPSS
ncbi:MAG: chemotaxis protein CheX [Candidatus Bathyarchaeia archaeon]